MWFPLFFLASPLSPTPPIITRGCGWRTDEVVEMAEGEEEKEKNNSPYTMFQINKSSCLKASEGTEGTKAKTRLFIFYSWIPPCLLMGAFFILPSQPGGAQNNHGAEGSSWNQAWTGCFFLFCPREGTILVSEHFLQESCDVKSGTWPPDLGWPFLQKQESFLKRAFKEGYDLAPQESCV